ncbi:hypothetical protein GTA08_BOTSDO00790 [Neofusicoccum parvum]|uniref:Uncharacterized protein n=1 Tax=Neofusicoccum parvum TaxID=310453 RepID=A0ACB5S4W0_9PEZI|nr:hypothetical protein GTA08_BOTSDO00790 [Neofusicoccum parvum]GME61030.1 hypothetical protein GTA08_BOTSDO00790 [Neofusicoccum parvum]
MDLNYYDSHASFRDSEPKYFSLLGDDEIPSWPSTLQTIEMNHLRQWTSGAAENFFSSLLDSAEELPNLRRLVLKAILNIGWRDRAGFRDKWIGRLQRVFLRKSPPPNSHFMSGKRWRTVGKLQHIAITPRGKAKSLLPTTEDTNSTDDNPDEDSGPSRHLRPRRAAAYTSAADTSESSPSSLEEKSSEEDRSSDDSKDWKRINEKFTQGMCEIVDIRIDNLRPREEQFNENDFLDSEASGDEDWNGDDNMPGDDGYAW